MRLRWGESMKLLKIAAVSIVILLFAGALSPPASADVSFGFFYSNLSPHGSWAVSDTYGRVWRPSVHAVGWNPYYDGRWVYTDLGWMWVSDYRWGYICYHYGTWVGDPVLGWVWIPGYVWAPAWVVFRTGPDYIGWAPVPPHFSVGGSIGFGDIEEDSFVFVSLGNFLAPRIRSYVVPATQTRVIVNRTQIINNISIENNIVVNRGLDIREVERISRKHVRAVPIERVERATPGHRFSRQEIRVDPQRVKQGVRVAELVSEREPPPAGRGRSLRRGEERTERQAIPERSRAREDRSRARPAAEMEDGRPSRVPKSHVRQLEQGDLQTSAERPYDSQGIGAAKQSESVTKQREKRSGAPSRQKSGPTRNEKKKKDSRKSPNNNG